VHQQLLDTIVDALEDDPTAATALADAREIVAEHLGQIDDVDLMTGPVMPPASWDRFIDLVDLTTTRLLANSAVRSLVPWSTMWWLPTVLAVGQPFGDEPLRFVGLPGIAGRPLWRIVTERDADALRASVAPGQVWIRADLLTARIWPRVRSRRFPGAARAPTALPRKTLLDADRRATRLERCADRLAARPGRTTPMTSDTRRRATSSPAA